MSATTFGRYLRKVRVKSNLSLRDLAASVGVSHVLLSEIERGKRPPLERKHWPRLVEAVPHATLERLHFQEARSQRLVFDLASLSSPESKVVRALHHALTEKAISNENLRELLEILGSHSVLSIGYEKRGIEEFLGHLRSNGVAKVVDVRHVPLSRKPEFRRKALTDSLRGIGVAYEHVQEAGNPFHKLKEDTGKCLALYRKHVRKQPSIIERFVGSLSEKTAVLCYEREHDSCHRSILLDETVKQGHKLRLSMV